jgi:hypothetical protein
LVIVVGFAERVTVGTAVVAVVPMVTTWNGPLKLSAPPPFSLEYTSI